MGHYLSALEVESKADRSPVTVADRGAEELLRALLARAFPADGILGEEFGETKGTSGRRWILDPIDGTQSFIRGVPLFGTLIGLESGGESVAGIMHFPALDETVVAARGLGAHWYPSHRPKDSAPRVARVSKVERLAQGLVTMTAPGHFGTIHRWDAYERLRQVAYLDRGWSDCYGHMLVATGRAEAMIDPIMHVWDNAPMLPILQEAGGSFTDWDGKATIHSPSGISTNGRVLSELLSVLRG